MKLKIKEFRRETGLKLKKLREALGYDQHRMAHHIGIGISGYRKNESGGSVPGPNTLFRLVSEHNISMDWFLFDRGTQNPVDENRIRELEAKLDEQNEKFQKELTLLKTEHQDASTGMLEKLEASQQQLETVTIQAAQYKEKMETLEAQPGTLKNLSPEMVEMLEQMLKNRTLKLQLLLQFSRFMDENQVQKSKEKTNP